MSRGVDASFWPGRRVLVTGHTGFKGAWLALWLEELGAQVMGLALPPEDAKGAFASMGPWPRLACHEVDLRDEESVVGLVESVDPDIVFHLGAQALVRRGYAEPFPTYAVNVAGTLNVLHAAARAPSPRAVVVVTSDKVYADTGRDEAFREGDPLGGDDPYSGSKALAELAVSSCRRGCLLGGGVAVATARAGNVIGGGDRGHDRLFPDAWRALEAGDTLVVRNPTAVRPWQFVLEPLLGYLLLAEHLVTDPASAPESLNFGPDPTECRPVAEVVERVFARWGHGQWRLDERSHPPEAPSLRLDATLARDVLGWTPRLPLESGIAWTVDWWRSAARGDDLRELARAQLHAYEAVA